MIKKLDLMLLRTLVLINISLLFLTQNLKMTSQNTEA